MELEQREISRASISKIFKQRFDNDPTVVAAAPGRVNLIGEHTDYNGGFVLPMALERYTLVAVAPSKGKNFRLSSTLGNEIVCIETEEINQIGEPFWTNFIRGVIANLQRAGVQLPPLDILVDSNVPRGGGLSSSAALEVATATALCAFAGVEMSTKEIALLGQRVEHEFANVPCGIMDQFISAHGKAGHALRLDCESLEYDLIPLDDPAVSVLIIDSAVKHSLADGAYAQRRRQCEDAAQIMGVSSLRHADLQMLEANKSKLGELNYRRARHVIAENIRTAAFAKALAKRDWNAAGTAMRASHASLRDDYEVSCAEVDTLVGLCDSIPLASKIHGARITGGGFGGCIVALVETEHVNAVAKELLAAYASATGIETTCLVTRAGAGARVLD